MTDTYIGNFPLEFTLNKPFVEVNVMRWIYSDMLEAGDSNKKFKKSHQQLIDCLEWKIDDCDDMFIKDCLTRGIQTPVVIELKKDKLVLFEGHHRFAVAWEYQLALPMVIVDDGFAWTLQEKMFENAIMWCNGELGEKYVPI